MTDNETAERERLRAVREHIRQRPQALERLTTDEVTVIAERVGLLRRDDSKREGDASV